LIKEYGEEVVVKQGLKALGFPVFIVSTLTEVSVISKYLKQMHVKDFSKG